MIPGTFEQAVDPSSTWVDVVYAQHLLDLYDSGAIADAAIFPSVLGAQAGDPRSPVQRHRAAPVVRRLRRRRGNLGQ